MATQPRPEATMDDCHRFVQQYIAELCHTLTCTQSSGERNYPPGGAFVELQRMLVGLAPRSHKVLAIAMIECEAVKHLAQMHSEQMKMRRSVKL